MAWSVIGFSLDIFLWKHQVCERIGWSSLLLFVRFLYGSYFTLDKPEDSLTLAGISLIFHFDASFRIGIVLGIVSSLLFAFYATLNERVNQSGQVVKTTALQMVGGWYSCFPLYFYRFTLVIRSSHLGGTIVPQL